MGWQDDGLAGDMAVGCRGHHHLLVREHHVGVHAHVYQLLLVGVVEQLDGEKLARVGQILASLRGQYGVDGSDANLDFLGMEYAKESCSPLQGGE